MCVEVEDFTPNATKSSTSTCSSGRGEEVDEERDAVARPRVQRAREGLAGKTFLVGDQFTIADIMYAPYIEYAMTCRRTDLAKHPHVMAWWGRVNDRPSWTKGAGRA